MQGNKKIQLILQPRDITRKYIYDYHAHIEVDGKDHPFGKGGGIDTDQKIAKLKATYEAIERYAGSVVENEDYFKSSYNEIKNQAINPNRLIYFKSSQYTKSFPFGKFDPSIKTDWLRGFSITGNIKTYIPAFAVYLGYNATQAKKFRFSPITSNGLALGSSLQDASIRGLLELVERDTALTLWYSRRIPDLIDLDSLSNADLIFIKNKIIHEGLTLDICISTLDIPIPTTIAVIRDGKNYPAVGIGLGCDFDLEKAALKAVLEALMVRNTLELLPKKLRKTFGRRSVKQFIDHALYYSFPSRTKLLKNLTSGEKISKEKLELRFKEVKKYKNLDLLINLLSKQNKEVLRYDLTTPLIKSMGYFVVKMIVPELQQIDISYKARFLNSKRLNGLISEDNINPSPHPYG